MLEAGIRGEQKVEVVYENTATAVGSGVLEVFATPCMLALMEKTACDSVIPYLEEGWGLGKSLQICLSYALLTSLVFLYMVLVTGDQMGVDTYLRDYFALIAELVFIQGVFLFAAFAAESTLVAVIAVIGVNLSQWQSYPMDWIWLIFKQGSNYLSGNRHMPVKCGMILCGLLLLGATAWISKRKKF